MTRVLDAGKPTLNSVPKSNQIKSSKASNNKIKIPSEECVQNLLNFLSDIVNDGTSIDVSILAVNDEMDHSNSLINDDLSNIPNELSDQYDNYTIFLDKLRRPMSFEITRSIQQFVAKFQMDSREIRTNLNTKFIESDYLVWADSIWKFMDHITHQIKQHPFWSNENNAGWLLTQESIERFVFTKLHPFIFAIDPEDVYLNQKIRERIASLSFLSPEHLDIKIFAQSMATATKKSVFEAVRELLQTPVNYLNELESARCPYDMLTCIKNCSISIAEILKLSHIDGSLPGADEFLPMLILSIKSSDVKCIHSIIKYLQRFVHSSKLMSEAGYLITHFVSAVHFLENVDATALTIAPEEFEISIEKSKLEAKKLNDLTNKRHQSRNISLNQRKTSDDSKNLGLDYSEEDIFKQLEGWVDDSSTSSSSNKTKLEIYRKFKF